MYNTQSELSNTKDDYAKFNLKVILKVVDTEVYRREKPFIT